LPAAMVVGDSLMVPINLFSNLDATINVVVGALLTD